MAKIIRASITFDIYPDENGTMEWEDEDAESRTEEELIDFARSELLECLYNGLKYNEVSEMIDVEIVEE
jgi:hypothetical protein